MGASSQFLPETQSLPPRPAAALNRFRDGALADSANKLVSATLEKMADEWRAGAGRPAELWLAEHAELVADPEDAVRVVYEEFCLREERGEQVDSEQYYRRFPQWQDQLAVVLQCHSLLRNDDPPKFPQAGESLGELRLLKELGRGALGRVFLATQPSLSDRPLAVKLTPRRGQEHLSLARLQHTHIVPLYLVQEFPREDLRAICMPYLGGATWGAILNRLQKYPVTQRTGDRIVQQLSAAQSTDASAPAAGPAISFLAQSSYVDAVCWLGACLTDALSYAHQRGLVHLDIKPSNVLLSGDGQPMLLDFHIASEIEYLQSETIDRLGGTPDYMSPEQRAAAEAVRNGTPLPSRLDGRSDIYSLGVLLYESLAGQLPVADLASARKNLQRANPRVSRGLTDILCKCLAPAPSARYADASQLATDLRCQLASLPLRNVGNRSLTERLQKWRRRKPYAVALAAFTLAATFVVGTVGVLFYRDRISAAEALLAQSQQELANNQFDSAIAHAHTARSALSLFPGQGDLKNRLKQQIAVAQQSQTKAALHELVEQLQFLNNQPLSDRKLAEISAGCTKVWQARQILIARSQPAASDATTNDPNTQIADEQLRRDVLDLAILSARLDVQLAPSQETSAARLLAIQRLDEARQICGPSPWLDLEQRDYSSTGENAAAETTRASLPKPANSWEYDALGRWLMRHGLYADAQRQFAAAIDLTPDDFWAHYQQMRCQFQLKRFDPALISASVCVALAPHRAECFYNRALCQQSLGHDDEALVDFGRALQLDSNFGPAALARGVLLGHRNRFTEAKADLEFAASRGARPSEAYYQLARLSLVQHDTPGANQWLQKSLADDPSHAGALALQTELALTNAAASK